MTKNTGTDVDLDSILIEIGQFGKYQIFILLIVGFPVLFSALSATEYIFNAGDLNYRCHIPECEGNPTGADIAPSWISNAIPYGRRCERFSPLRGAAINETCPASIFDTSSVVSCDDYVYEKTNTILYEFGLNCEDWKRALVGTLRSVGTLIVLPITGYISDRFGRRAALIINAFNTALIGLIRSFSTSYEMFLVLSILEPSIGAGALSTCFVIATEWLGPRWRSLSGPLITCTFAVGQASLALLAWAFPYWRTLTRVVFIPQFIFILYYWILPESVRWLLSKNQINQAEAILKRAAKINGKKISNDSLQKFTASTASMDKVTNEKQTLGEPKSSLFMQVIRSPIILKRICTTPVWWVTCTLVFYGLSINSVGLNGNMYINFILVSLVEIPGNLTALLALNIFGRKPSLCFSFMMCGLSNFSFSFIPEDVNWLIGGGWLIDEELLKMAVYLSGKFFISMTFTSVYVYTAELFPTESRHTLFAFSSMVGRIGSIVAPQTPLLIPIWEPFPTTIFGSMAILSGLLVLTTPETKGTKLPDTIDEAEKLGK